GFGSDGPYRERGGFDLIAQGMGGIMHVTGEPDGPPTSVGLPICDLGTGMWGVQGILAALYERQRTGEGQKIECSLLETAVGFSSWTSAGWLVDHKEPTREGSRHRQNAPYQRFETKDGYLMLGAAGQGVWERCAKALGHPHCIEDPRHRAKARPAHGRDPRRPRLFRVRYRYAPSQPGDLASRTQTRAPEHGRRDPVNSPGSAVSFLLRALKAASSLGLPDGRCLARNMPSASPEEEPLCTRPCA